MKLSSVIRTIWIPALILLTACGSRQKQPTLVVSVEPQRALLEEIVGDKYDVVTLLSRGANPETFEPSIKMRKTVDDATVYFTTGFLPFEHSLAETLNADTEIVDSSVGIEPIYGTHSHRHEGENHECEEHEGEQHESESHEGHHHSALDADPHTWASVKNAKIIAKTMVDKVVEIDPANADTYRQNYEGLVHRLDSLDNAIADKLANIPTRVFAVWHPSLSYFARDYGLTQLSVGFENKEVSPRQIAHIAEEAQEHGVRTFFFQADYDSRQATTLNEAMGTRMLSINPLEYNWEAELTKIADALAE